MARKVFVSYKYADSDVENLFAWRYPPSTVRDYVTEFQSEATQKGIIINKGEEDGEDLSKLSEQTIWLKLRDRIYDSTVTVVFISPNMRNPFVLEKNQWIPREISFSLREQSRSDRTSYPNSLLFVVLPNHLGGYNYYKTMQNFSIVEGNINNGYGLVVEWRYFIKNISYYIEEADKYRLRTPDNNIVKTI